MVMDHHVTKQTKSTTTTRKSKHHGIDHQLLSSTQNKKTKIPGRGLGVAQLEQIRIRTEQVEKTKAATSLHYHQYPLQNGVVQFPTHQNHYHYQQQQLIPLTNSPAVAVPQMMVSGPNHVFMDHNNVVHYPINSNPGYRFDNRNEMFSSAQNYVKYCGGSDAACGTSCYKKTRVNNMSGSNNNNLNTSNQFRYGLNNNNAIEKVDYTGKNHLCFSPQVREVMPGYRRVRYGMAEYEFFPGKAGGGEMTSSWCVSGGGCTERGGGMIGSHGGEGSSCVTAVTSTNEEGSVCCSVDLSLKL